MKFPEFCYAIRHIRVGSGKFLYGKETMRQAKDFYARFERIVSFIVASKVRQYYGTV